MKLSKSAVSYLRFVASPATSWASFCDAWGTPIPSVRVIGGLANAGLIAARDNGLWSVTPKGLAALTANAGESGLDHTPTDDYMTREYL